MIVAMKARMIPLKRIHLNAILAVVVGILFAIATARHFSSGSTRMVGAGTGNGRVSSVGRGSATGSNDHHSGEERRLPAPKLTIQDLNYGFFREATRSSDINAPFHTLASDGRLTKGALDFVGVDQGRRREIQRIIDTAYGKIESSIKNRLRPVQEESDDEKGIQVYQVPGDRVEGEGVLKEMAGNIAALIGERETMILFSGMDLSQRYALFGMSDTRIEITARDGYDRPDEAFVVRITQFDPETKQKLSNRVCLIGGLKESFGSVFAISDGK